VRPNDDIIDILGFLAFEMVRSLCVTALEVREQLERSASSTSGKRKMNAGADAASKRPRTDGGVLAQPRSLFAPPPSARQPLLPSHVLEAFAQIQRKQTSNRVSGMRNWRGGMSRGRVALV
jgi:transcription initiation protein SPT3